MEGNMERNHSQKIDNLIYPTMAWYQNQYFELGIFIWKSSDDLSPIIHGNKRTRIHKEQEAKFFETYIALIWLCIWGLSAIICYQLNPKLINSREKHDENENKIRVLKTWKNEYRRFHDPFLSFKLKLAKCYTKGKHHNSS